MSEQESLALARTHGVRSVPAYRLVDPGSNQVLYRQNGGSPNDEALSLEIDRWQPSTSP